MRGRITVHRPRIAEVADRGADVRVRRAPADVAAHPLGDLGVVVGVAFLQQLHPGHDLARGAAPALGRVAVDERCLDGMLLPARASSSIVVTSWPSQMATSVRHASTRRPSTRTVQATHMPSSHPSLTPASLRRNGPGEPARNRPGPRSWPRLDNKRRSRSRGAWSLSVPKTGAAITAARRLRTRPV
jgi:hypothetical protein